MFVELKPKYRKIEAFKMFYESIAMGYCGLREILLDAKIDYVDCKRILFNKKKNLHSQRYSELLRNVYYKEES